MFFMCFFKDISSNVPVNWLVKWVVLTSPLEWNYKIFSKKDSTSKIKKKMQAFIPTLSFHSILLWSGPVNKCVPCSVHRFLPSVFNTQFFPSRKTQICITLSKWHTLSLATTPKCWGHKRYLFNTYLSHINYRSGNDFLFQECTLFEAAIV